MPKIRILIAVATCLFLITCTQGGKGSKASPSEGQQVYDVVVVGGGIAGLTAAYELNKKGRNVLVLEMATHLGGRVRTKHWPAKKETDPKAEKTQESETGFYSELGAEDILDNEEDLTGLIAELGLKLVENEAEMDGHYFEGKFYAINDWEKNMEAIFPIKAELKAFHKVIDAVVEDVGHLEFPLNQSPHMELDSLSMAQWLDRLGGKKGIPARVKAFIRTILLSEVVTELEETNALIAIQNLYDWSEGGWFHVEGGNEQIIEKMAETLKGKIRLRAEVISVADLGDKVLVEHKTPDKLETVKAKAVILAIPPNAVSALQITPELTAEKKTAMRQLKWGRFLNAHLYFSERIWKTKYNFPSWDMITDLPANYVVDATYNQTGKGGILSLFLVGPDADKYSRMEEAEFVQAMLKDLEKAWPGISKYCEKSTAVRLYWPFAVSVFAPGHFKNVWPELVKPFGNIYFAGAYTEQPGWDGAVYSAKRAVSQLQKAGGSK